MIMVVFKSLLFLVVLNSKPIFQDQLKQKKNIHSPVNLISHEKPRISACSTHALSDLERFTLVWRI